MSVQIIRGNALDLPLADNSVDLVVTSPPYFSLRSYQDGGEHYDGQIGAEATPAEFVDALVAATREMVRVVKPSGSIFVNLGDKYVSTPPGNERSLANSPEHQRKGKASYDRVWRQPEGFRQKSLMGIPWRYALRCIDTSSGVPVPVVRQMLNAVRAGTLDSDACDALLAEYETGGQHGGLGLILRAEIIWSKPNGLPESVTDRVRRSHETWFHLVKSPRYYSAIDHIREAYGDDSLARRLRYGQAARGGGYAAGDRNDADRGGPMGFADASNANPLGKLPGSVWTVPTQPLTVPASLGVDHFAAFPMEWPRRFVRGWSPAGVCTACGDGRRPVASCDREHVDYGLSEQRATERVDATAGALNGGTKRSTLGHQTSRTITGEACACPDTTAPTTPGVVLDPFGGTGTTALVAHALGRHGITVDLSRDYCRLAEWRTTDPGQLAAALQVEKPPAAPDGMDSLLDLIGDPT